MASASEQQDPGAKLPRRDVWIALAACFVLALVWTIPLSRERAWGWDESMHAELPAARVVLALKDGDFGGVFDAINGCAQYPFVWPCVLALVQLVTGISEHACRIAGTLAWCATLFGVFLVAREVVRALRVARGVRNGDRVAPFAALVLAAACPLALAFAGTLFLEVPATCALVWSLRAWLVRRREGSRRAELAAGAWIALLLFTKFNYGLLFGLGIALDLAFEFVAARRADAFAAHAWRTAWLALVPVLACAWWFVLPLPGGFSTGAEHRRVFLEFLGGNQGFAPEPWSVRLHYLGNLFALTPRVFALELLLALLALRAVKIGAVRTLLLVLLATYVPVALHPFHLERFLVPCGPAFWLLAALGAGAACASRAGKTALAAACALALVAPDADREPLAANAGRLAAEAGPLRDYQHGILDAARDLTGSRAFQSGGLSRAEHTTLSAILAGAIGADERVGWIGMSSEYGPAVLHLALLEHGGSPERFRREALRTLDVTYFGGDPGWDDARLAEWARGFDVIVHTDPMDLKDRPNAARRTLAALPPRLAALGWSDSLIGRVAIARPLKPPTDVALHVLRPKP